MTCWLPSSCEYPSSAAISLPSTLVRSRPGVIGEVVASSLEHLSARQAWEPHRRNTAWDGSGVIKADRKASADRGCCTSPRSTSTLTSTPGSSGGICRSTCSHYRLRSSRRLYRSLIDEIVHVADTRDIDQIRIEVLPAGNASMGRSYSGVDLHLPAHGCVHAWARNGGLDLTTTTRNCAETAR